MQRVVALTLATLMVLSVGVGAVAARRHEPAFQARASQHAEPGGWFRVASKVKHPERRKTFSATAVVHFASGDVTIDLTRKGPSFTAVGRVRVPADAFGGAVPVDVTILYGDETMSVATEGDLDGPEGDPDPDPQPDPDPPPVEY